MTRLHLARRTAVSALLVQAAVHRPLALPVSATIELSDEQQTVVDAWAVVQRAFYDPSYNGVDWKATRSEYVKKPYKSMKEARAGIRSMLGQLNDRYTRYVTPAQYESLMAQYKASPDDGGIGVQLGAQQRDGRTSIEIVAVTEGSPAALAGLRVGDIVSAVNGKALSKDAVPEDVAALIIGPLGERLRVSTERLADVELSRAPLRIGEVKATTVARSDGRDSTVGVVTVPLFSEGTAWNDSFKKALLAATAPSSTDEILIDLRGNPGGSFPKGVEAAQLFLPSGVAVVSTKDRNGAANTISTVANGPYYQTLPLTVLVDRGTMSAAEVFAAALQENAVATVVGDSNSFGKALIQTIAKTTDGGAVICTTARYLTPSGRDINGIGVAPDRVVDAACSRTPRGAVECLEKSKMNSK